MVRHAKWISSTALGLLLAWNGLPAHAQQFSFESEPAQDTAADDADNSTADSDEQMDAPSEDYSNDSDSEYSDSASEATETPAEPEQQTEVIKERYPNGAIKIEREVTQDAGGNYLNHGAWKMWDQAGNLMAQGEYRYGNRTGTWIRWYRTVTDASMLSKAPYSQFGLPYISQATFDNGRLHGEWTIYDGKKRKISQWHFADGKRHGASTWWFPNGRKLREIQYKDGDIDGQLIEYGAEGSVLTKDNYQEGRKLSQKKSTYNGGAKKSEGTYLFAKDVEKTPDDWWECKVQTTVKTGKDEKHGPWTSWHTNGQRQLEGTYEHDMQTGLFTWWHANGQKALEGRFEAGKQNGSWTWWYPTGQKSIHGEYAHGNPTGRWTWWKEDGKVAQSADLSQSEGVVIQTMPTDKPNELPQLKKQVPANAKKQPAKPAVRR